MWAPSEYLRAVKLCTEEKKESLRATYPSWSRKNNVPVGGAGNDIFPRSGTPPPSLNTSNSSPEQPQLEREGSKRRGVPLSKKDISSPSLNSYSRPHIPIEETYITKRPHKLTKEDISGPITVTKHRLNNNQIEDQIMLHPLPMQQASSFKPQSTARLNSAANNSLTNHHQHYQNNNVGIASSAMASISNSNRSSRLSLYDDGSCDSLSDILEDNNYRSTTSSAASRRRGIKSHSFDGLATEVQEAISAVAAGGDDNQNQESNAEKSTSFEKLDSRRRTAESSSLMNQLSYRNRSNSVDFKTLSSKENVASDSRNELFEKGYKLHYGKDVNYRRRSLVLEEGQSLKQYKPFTFGEVDVSATLDAPPKLPPKQKKCVTGSFSIDPIDVKRKQTKHQESIQTRRKSHELESSSKAQHGSASSGNNSGPLSDSGSLMKPRQTATLQSGVAASSRTGSAVPDATAAPRQPPVALPRNVFSPTITITIEKTDIAAVELASDGKDKENEKDDLKRSFKEKSGLSTRKSSIRGLFSKSTKESKNKNSPSPENTLKNKKLPEVSSKNP